MSKKELRRAEIILSVIESIAKEGFEQTTLDKIGKRFGMRRSHVAYYFSGREEMLLASMKHVAMTAQAMTMERVAKAKNPAEGLKAIVDGAVDWIKDYPDHSSVLMLFYQMCTHNSEFRKLQRELRAVGCKRLETILVKYLSTTKQDPREISWIAKQIQNLITGCLLDFSVSNSSFSFPQLKKSILTAVEDLIRGHVNR